MPKTTTKGIESIAGLDLAYAVRCLIAAGKTSAAEVSRLAAERGERIKALQAELAQLKGGKAPAAAPIKAPRATKARQLAARPARSSKRTAAKATKTAPAGKALRTTKRKDGRPFTVTQKVVDARRVQGQYLGYLRQVPKGPKRTAFQAVAKDKGVPAAVEALKKHLGKA